VNLLKPITVQNGGQLSVLDIGCALGDFTEKLWQLNPRGRLWGIDISENAIASVSARLPAIQFKVAALPDLDFANEFFDLVICAEVLYYLDQRDRQKSLNTIWRIMAHDGYMLLSGTLDGGNRYFDREGIINLLLETGFKIQNVWYLYGRLYNSFEAKILWLYNVVTTIREVIEMPQLEYEQWLKEKTRTGLGIISSLRKIIQISGWTQKATIKMLAICEIVLISSIKFEAPISLAYKLTKVIIGNKGVTKVIILARKSDD
jgi:ubiquinone/menaquinone biosynthesis C-methylase UbiE